jgi:glycosyltransferase involved in cell wall biosynthesis
MATVLHTRVVNGSGGGPDKTILNSPRFLSDAGYRTLCAYMHHPDDSGFDQLRQKAKLWSAPVLSVHDRGPWDWQVVSQLLRICRQERVCIWHAHDYKSNVLGILLRQFWPMKLVTTVHGWVKRTRRTPLYYGIDRLCLPHYETVICVSADLYECCLAYRVPASRCVLIENAIDTQEFCRKWNTLEAKERLGVPGQRLLVGSVGRLSEEKGFDRLIHAADQLLGMGFDLELRIIGDGDQRASLQKLIRELGREERIQLLGYRSDLRELYQAMDVFVLSSLREGLPNVLLEAMAMEVPVVATRIAGVPRLVREENGLLVEAGQVNDLIQALCRLLADSALRRRMASAARRDVAAGYSFAARMQKIRAIYDSLLQQN